jgi:hypothetical protein
MSANDSKLEIDINHNKGGCISTIIALIVVWALLFGVTIDGKHYGLTCDCNHGVVVDRGVVK